LIEEKTKLYMKGGMLRKKNFYKLKLFCVFPFFHSGKL